MAKINLTPNEFADFVTVFLFDKSLHPKEIVPNNVKFNEIMEDMRGKGMRPLFLNYYMGLDANMRVKYKRIKDSLDGTSTDTSIINIKPEVIDKKKEKKAKKPGMVKRVIKKLLKKEEISDEERNLLLEALDEDINIIEESDKNG